MRSSHGGGGVGAGSVIGTAIFAARYPPTAFRAAVRWSAVMCAHGAEAQVSGWAPGVADDQIQDIPARAQRRRPGQTVRGDVWRDRLYLGF